MNSSQSTTKENKMVEQGRATARAMHELKVQQQRNVAKAVKRKSTMLENAAQRALSGQ